MRYGVFAKYKGKEFATADDCAGIVLLSGYISDIEEYGFKVCEPFDLMGFKRVVCVKVVNLSEVDEYYLIRVVFILYFCSYTMGFFFFYFMTTPVVYGNFQARGLNQSCS